MKKILVDAAAFGCRRGPSGAGKTEIPDYLSGVTLQGAASRRFVLTSRIFATAEGKLTTAWARVPIVDGNATVPNIAFHVLAGLGVQF